MATDRAALHAPFRPRRARQVAYPLAVVVILVLAAVGLLLRGDPDTPYAWWDRAGIALVGVAVGFLLYRLGSVSARPDEQRLRVRNLLTTTDVAWAQIVSVRFGGGGPWVMLDLADGESLAVMGVQRSDGERATRESTRLATLVALHSRTERDD